jgi:Ca2+/Na+ antiporter
LFSLLIESYHIFYLLDDLEFFKHAPLYFGQIYFLITLCFIFYFVQFIYKLHDRYHQWQPNVDVAILDQKIAKQSSRLTTFALVLIIISVSGGLLFAIPTQRDSEIYLTITWLENHAPENMRYFIALSMRTTFVLFYPIFQIPYIQLSYGLQHQKIQIDFFLLHLKNINIDYENFEEEELIYNQKYQENIAQRLVFCVRRHVEFLTLGKKMCKQNELILFIFTVIGCLLAISFLMFTIEVRFQNNISQIFKAG